MGEQSFLTELKRRNVIRMAGLYLVGAWLLVQVASTLLPTFGAPDGGLLRLQTEPMLEPLKTDPRYPALRRKVGFGA